jgi:hypothetical protein
LSLILCSSGLLGCSGSIGSSGYIGLLVFLVLLVFLSVGLLVLTVLLVLLVLLVLSILEVGQEISELSRELSTNEIALFSIVLSAEFGQKNLHSTENKSRKNINIKIFLQNFKCSSTTAKDMVISAKIPEVNVIFNAILMFEVSRLPATC